MWLFRKASCTALLLLALWVIGSASAWAIGCIGSAYYSGISSKAVKTFTIDSTNTGNDTVWMDFSNQFNNLTSGITFGQNGSVYVPQQYVNNYFSIESFKYTGSTWGSDLRTCYVPEEPSTLVIDANNVLYTAVYYNTDDHIYYDVVAPGTGTASVFSTVTVAGTVPNHTIYDMRIGPSGSFGQNMIWLAKQNYGFISLVPYNSISVDIDWTAATYARAFDIGQVGTDVNTFVYMINYSSGTIERYDPTNSTFNPVTVLTDTSRLQYVSGQRLPQSLCFGPSFKGLSGKKDIYVSDAISSTVNVYRTDTLGWVGSFSNTGGYATNSIASWIAAGVNGYVATSYYQNANVHQVAVYNSTGKCLQVCAIPSYEICTAGVAFASNGNLYSLSWNNTANVGQVDMFAYQGAGVWSASSTKVCTVPDGDSVAKLALDGSNNVYVGMYDNNKIYNYTSGSTTGVMSLWMTAPGASSFFCDMRIGRTKGSPSSPRLWAAKLNQALMSFTVGGDQNMNIPFANARGFDFGPDKMLYAANFSTGTIDKYNPYTGSLIQTGFVNDPTNLKYNSGVVLPNSLTFGPLYNTSTGDTCGGDMYVGDYYGSNIHVYNGSTGGLLGSINNGNPVAALSSWQPNLLTPTAAPSSPIYSNASCSTATGDISVTVNGDVYTIASMFSTPNGSWVHGLTPNNYFKLNRTMVQNNESLLVYDTFSINTSNWTTDLPLMEQHTATVNNPMRNTWVQGYPSTYQTLADGGNPTSIAATDHSAIGLVPDCDVFQVHASNSVNGQAVTLADNNFVLQYNTTMTVTWGVVLSRKPDYFSVINATRRLWGSNFTFDGTQSSLIFDPTLFGTMSKTDVQNYVTFKSSKYLENSQFSPYYVYQDYGTGNNYSCEMYQTELLPTLGAYNQYAISYIGSCHTDCPGLKTIAYYHDILENVNTVYKNFSNDQLLFNNGTQVTYFGDPHYAEFIPYTKPDLSWTNAWGNSIGDCIPYILNPVSSGGLGYDGIFWDEMEYSYQRYQYGTSVSDSTGRHTPPWSGSVPWDGCSADISTSTNQITNYKSSMELITQPFRLKWAGTVIGTASGDYNAVLIANGPPHTRSMAALHFPRVTETSPASNCNLVQLYTPIGLGDLYTENTPQDCYNHMLTYLNYGCLYYWYGQQIRPTHTYLTAEMYPITPVELHNGYVIGVDRVITNSSGVYQWPDNGTKFTLSVYDNTGTNVYNASVTGAVSGNGYYAKPFTVGGNNYLQLWIDTSYSAGIHEE
jgi:hypothetical protein